MRRRDFIKGIAVSTFGWPLAARAQRPERMRLLGALMGSVEHDPAVQSQHAAFRGALTKLGWIEGTNLRIELRWAAGDPDRARSLAKELVDPQPDAIYSQTTLATGALFGETRTIPIVFAVVADPIGNGFVEKSRPS